MVVFEPYQGENGNTVERIMVEKRDDGDVFTALTVYGKKGSHQHIFQALDPDKTFTTSSASFRGYYGVVGFEGTEFTSIYLGKGTEISMNGYFLKSSIPDGSANLYLYEGDIKISCNQPTEIGFPVKGKVKRITLLQGSTRKELLFNIDNKIIYVSVPAIENGLVLTE